MSKYIKIIIIFILIIKASPMLAEIVIDPGDNVLLRIIGVVDRDLLVESDGTIDFDLKGKLKIAGLTHDQAVKAIQKHFAKFLKNKEVPVFLSIKKKIIEKHEAQISVFGEVRSPGSYPYREILKVLDYIVLSGGTTRFALTENIKVICLTSGQSSGKNFNLQKYSAGIQTDIPAIKPGCVIYIPEKPAEKASWLRNRPEQVVHIFGQVNKPGRYEFSEEFGFLDILSHAGGISLQADMSKVSVISRGRVRTFNLEGYLRNGGSLPHLHTSDVIYVPERPKTNSAKWTKVSSEDSIYLVGEFIRPGRYDYLSTLNFLDFFSQAGGPADKADLENVIIIRDNKKLAAFNFQNYFLGKGEAPPVLISEDMIYIPKKSTEDAGTGNINEEAVYLMGGFKKQGKYTYEEKFNFLDYLSQAGGPSNDADLGNIGIIRNNKRIYTFDFISYQKGENKFLPPLLPEDMIVIPQFSSNGKWMGTPSNLSIYLIGAFKQPGRYNYSAKLNFLDYFSQAGGPVENADIKKIVLIRKDEKRMIINFHLYQAGAITILPKLQPEDMIYIPTLETNEWVKRNPDQIINVMGEVNTPGRYEVNESNLNIIDILAAADGPGSDADISEIKIIRRKPEISKKNNKSMVEVLVFDFEAFQETGDISQLPEMYLGDTVFVPKQDVNYWEEFKTIGGTLTTLLLLLLFI
jgi:protein involved in polysaccharide export with SLBB domain